MGIGELKRWGDPLQDGEGRVAKAGGELDAARRELLRGDVGGEGGACDGGEHDCGLEGGGVGHDGLHGEEARQVERVVVDGVLPDRGDRREEGVLEGG